MSNKDALVKLWFEKAEHDLMAIDNNLANASGPLTDICCFHAQQAIEKLLKGALVFLGKHITKTHDLIFLANQLLKDIPEIQKYKSQLEEIAHFGVEVRYPDFLLEPSVAETKEAQQTALEIKSIILSKIKL